jgi:DNA replication and repair protein RecF
LAGGPAAAFAIRRLTLTNFRSYAGLRFDPAPGPVVLTGENGAGKTNLLEALSYLAPGRGLRRARLEDVLAQFPSSAPTPDSAGWAVAADITGPAGGSTVGTQWYGPGAGQGRRAVKVDGVATNGASLARALCLNWLTPQMDRLFIDGSAGRRRFLDRIVYGFEPEHARRVSAYEKAMRDRARLLRDGAADPSWLAALEESMSEHGIAVAASRRSAVTALNTVFETWTGPFPRARLGLDGDVENWLQAGSALDAEDRFRAALQASRRHDAQTGGAASGPHRSDFLAVHVGKDMPAEHCSTGEQKALLIAIVLAEARLQAVRRQAVPVLLLDEVAAHLDARRRHALFDEIRALGAQVWLTGTDRSLFAALDGAAQFVAVADSRLSGTNLDP